MSDQSPSMRGSEGKVDYAIIAIAKLFALGIKFIFQAAPNPAGPNEPPLLFAGFRIRSAANPTGDPFSHTPEECAKAFPAINFTKVGESPTGLRASAVFGLVLPLAFKDAHLGPQAAIQARFTSKMMQWVLDSLGVDAPDLLSLKSEEFRTLIDEQIAAVFEPVIVAKLKSSGPAEFQEKLTALVAEFSGTYDTEATPIAYEAENTIVEVNTSYQKLIEQALANSIGMGPSAGPDEIEADGTEEVVDTPKTVIH